MTVPSRFWSLVFPSFFAGLAGCSSTGDGGTEPPTSADDSSSASGDSGPVLAEADQQYLALAGTLTTLDVAVTTKGYAASNFTDTPPVVYHLTEANAVADAYRRIFALPALPADTDVLCHIELPGYTYELTFSDATEAVLRFDVAPTGNCQWLESLKTDSYVTDADFWARLSADLGIPESSIYPPPLFDLDGG